MSRFVRRSQLIISGQFFAPESAAEEAAEIAAGTEGDPVLDTDLSSPQPAAATCQLSYTNMLGIEVITTINLTMDPTSLIWSGTWDSSDSNGGRVEWVVFSSGAVIAATEGSFELFANDANLG